MQGASFIASHRSVASSAIFVGVAVAWALVFFLNPGVGHQTFVPRYHTVGSGQLVFVGGPILAVGSGLVAGFVAPSRRAALLAPPAALIVAWFPFMLRDMDACEQFGGDECGLFLQFFALILVASASGLSMLGALVVWRLRHRALAGQGR